METVVASPAEFRQVLGNFASGVTVVTGMNDGEPVGFACQSFAAVSLEPPLILFCADHRGRAWPRIRNNGRFCVNVLSEEQGEVCERFGSSRGRRFEGLDFDVSRWGTPSLRGVLVRIHGSVMAVHVAGDHDIVVGRVTELEQPREGRPMVFFRGTFSLDGPTDPRDSIPYVWGWGDHWG